MIDVTFMFTSLIIAYFIVDRFLILFAYFIYIRRCGRKHPENVFKLSHIST